MASGVTMTATADGAPLAELQRLLSRRIFELGEDPVTACHATASDCLTSIRALTRKAKIPKSMKDLFPVYFPEFTCLTSGNTPKGWHASYKDKKRCVRNGFAGIVVEGQDSGRIQFRNVVKGPWPKDPVSLGVWRVTYWNGWHNSKKDVYTFFIVSRDAESVRKWCLAKVRGRVRKYRGMARFALSLAKMRMMSTGGEADPDVRPSAKAVARGRVYVRDSVSKGAVTAYAVDITDALDYAADAVKGGRPAVTRALMMAANKIAGRLGHRYNALMRVRGGDEFHAAFPELKTVRKGRV